jgi:hypothetical protein
MPLCTIATPETPLDDLVDAIVLGAPSLLWKDDRATVLKYEKATGLMELRHEMISMVSSRLLHIISDYSLICVRIRAGLFSLNWASSWTPRKPFRTRFFLSQAL